MVESDGMDMDDMDDMDMEGTDEPHDMDDMDMDNTDMEATDEPHDMDMDDASETSAAYMTITNNGDEDDTLVEVQADFANVTELHETTIEDDVAQMRMVGEFEIPAGETIELAPAGKHVMLMDLQSDLVMDESVELTLIFESGRRSHCHRDDSGTCSWAMMKPPLKRAIGSSLVCGYVRHPRHL